ncbi:MAG: FAD-dependent oxidoreductase, partial [Acidobacteriaceae bacterium]
MPRSVTVVGGGVAGLAAACALSDSGYGVRLLERRP